MTRWAREQAIEHTIAHWKRMIEWAEKQPPGNTSNWVTMKMVIGESWHAEYCPLCREFYPSCGYCPLGEAYGPCDEGLSDPPADDKNAWVYVRLSPTWKQWLKHARRMLQQLKSLREAK